ncbi:MAG: hypothetical protein N3A67_06465 [Ignavibacteria bacterium]|nr:hypothetical protein [Ignavibacteria bacterium]
MPTFSISSNGRLEKTVVFYNGEQLTGLKEIYININEEGNFEAIIQYQGTDKKTYVFNIFEDYLINLKTTESTLTDLEFENLVTLTIESDGNLENTSVFIDDEYQEGVVSLYVHIKGADNKDGIRKFLSSKYYIPDTPELYSEIIFRNEDGSFDKEKVF